MPKTGTATLARRLGARVRALRLEVGLTQERLAWDCDLAKPYLSQIESGKRLPSLGALSEIAHRLGVELIDVVGWDDSNPRAQLLDGLRRKDQKAVKTALNALRLS